jgi:hypothetical protein
MSATLALLAALAFAVGTVLQQRGSLSTEAPEGDPRFLIEIVKTPVWRIGAACQAAGWVLQASALARGSLVLVQALCSLSLVFALPLGARLTDQVIGTRSLVGAVLTLGGIVTFIAVAQPAGGTTAPAAAAWWSAAIAAAAAMWTLARIARRRGGAIAAALFATGAGISFAYQAAVTKEFTAQLGHGVAHLLATWSTYVLIVSALAGFALQQSALKTGRLAPAMAASNAATLIMSAVFGGVILGEHLVGSEGNGPVGLVGLGCAVTGVIILASTPGPPPTREPSLDGPARRGDVGGATT